MNVGVISDIHGDYAALETALDRLRNIHRVDLILCAGDLVGRGPQPDSVVELIRQYNIPTVRGNHDEFNYGLTPENKAFLRTLPLEWRGTLEGQLVYMTHGKPGNNLWGLYRDHVSNTLLNMMLDSLGAQVLITGHTHMPLYVRVENGCVINPGSLYTFHNVRSSSHTYGVLMLPQLSFELFDLTQALDAERISAAGD
ncbi:MAG: metallophosphoesterase family protein [Candidatus Flexifilum sp.]|jgi:putative phosphoesterase